MRRLGLLVLATVTCCASCSPNSGTTSDTGYWSGSCLSGDRRHLVAGGDHAALVDPTTGTVVLRVPGMVKALACDGAGAVVVGYVTAFRLPGRTPEPLPSLGETLLARGADGAWISTSRRSSGGGWRGPATARTWWPPCMTASA